MSLPCRACVCCLELTAARAEVARLEALFQQTHGVHHSWVAKAQEADRLRAVLADTPENVGAVANATKEWLTHDEARTILAALRSRAGIE